MADATYTKKVWKRYFGIVLMMLIMVYIFPSSGKAMPIFLGSFTSNYLYSALPSMRPTFREKCCSVVGMLFFLTCGYLFIEYAPYYIPWAKDAQIQSTFDFLIFMFLMLSFLLITFLTGYVIALYLSIIFFGRGEIGNRTIKQYMLKDFPKIELVAFTTQR